MSVDLYQGLAHYGPHLIDTWKALSDDLRGTWWCAPRCAEWARQAGVQPRVGRPPTKHQRLLVVGGFGDMQVTRGHRHVLIEHGSGQQYGTDDPSYSGGEKRESAAMFLCPNPTVAARNTARYPDAEVAVVGSPRVDHLRGIPRSGGAVVLSFHWDASRVHEAAGWALPWYEAGLSGIVRDLAAQGVTVVGHGHPRFARHFARLWERLGIEHVPDFADVLRRASVYVCDNSSTQYEAAACGIPNVVLDAPWYPGPEANLWPRFAPVTWDVGEHVSGPDEVVPAIGRALQWPSEEAAVARERAVDVVYPMLDGKAAERSAAAIAKTCQAET